MPTIRMEMCKEEIKGIPELEGSITELNQEGGKPSVCSTANDPEGGEVLK